MSGSSGGGSESGSSAGRVCVQGVERLLVELPDAVGGEAPAPTEAASAADSTPGRHARGDWDERGSETAVSRAPGADSGGGGRGRREAKRQQRQRQRQRQQRRRHRRGRRWRRRQDLRGYLLQLLLLLLLLLLLGVTVAAPLGGVLAVLLRRGRTGAVDVAAAQGPGARLLRAVAAAVVVRAADATAPASAVAAAAVALALFLA